MKIFVFAFIMALMVALIGADSSEEKFGRHRKHHHKGYYDNFYYPQYPQYQGYYDDK